jgi:hypothetical protein
VDGRYDRREYSGTTSLDITAFDLTHEHGSLRVEKDSAQQGVDGGVYLDYLRRDGLSLGSRHVDFGFVENVPVRREERRVGAGGDLSFDSGGFEIQLAGGAERLAGRDRRNFSEPSPSDPDSIQTEDFEAEDEGLSGHGNLSVSRELNEGLRADLELSYAQVNLDGDLNSFETGILFDPSLPFERTTVGDFDVEERELELELGLTRKVSASLSLELRYAHQDERGRGDLTRTVTLDEFSGPPTTSTFDDKTELDSVLDLIQGGLYATLTSWLDASIHVEGGLEDLAIEETADEVTIRSFDDTVDSYGAHAELGFEPSASWRVDLAVGYSLQPTENSQTGTTFDVQDGGELFASLKGQWLSARGASFRAEARTIERDSEAFDSESRTHSFALGGGLASEEGWSVDASAALRVHNLRAETVNVLLNGGFPVFFDDVVRFNAAQQVYTASLAREVTPDFRPRLAGSASFGTGDSRFGYGSGSLALPVSLGEHVEIGVELTYVRFDGEDFEDANDYTAWIGVLYLRHAF